jgi:lysophospholipase L1-like esterase
MKNILCFGDSNTWGCKPIQSMDSFERYTKSERWPGILQSNLGDGFDVIEEGLGGRTTLWDDPLEGYKNGRDYLIPCLNTHQPLDLVILMLGTNDLKARFSLPASDIAASAGSLVELIQGHKFQVTGCPRPAVLLIAPPPVLDTFDLPEIFKEMFEGAATKSRRFSTYYRNVAEHLGCSFLDAAEFLQVSPIDGIHFDAAAHQKMADVVADKVRQIFL